MGNVVLLKNGKTATLLDSLDDVLALVEEHMGIEIRQAIENYIEMEPEDDDYIPELRSQIAETISLAMERKLTGAKLYRAFLRLLGRDNGILVYSLFKDYLNGNEKAGKSRPEAHKPDMKLNVKTIRLNGRFSITDQEGWTFGKLAQFAESIGYGIVIPDKIALQEKNGYRAIVVDLMPDNPEQAIGGNIFKVDESELPF